MGEREWAYALTKHGPILAKRGRAVKRRFLRRIRKDYPAHWRALLGTNALVSEYEQSPGKLLRFVEALATAAASTDDLAATTNLAAISSAPAFYANPNAYQPETRRAAAEALLKLGPNGRRALADSFSEEH
jgi:hypothetical protein